MKHNFLNALDDWGDILVNTYEGSAFRDIIFITYKNPYLVTDTRDGTEHHINRLEIKVDTSVPLSGMSETVYDATTMGFIKTFKAININYCNNEDVIYTKNTESHKEIIVKFRVFLDCNKNIYIVQPYIHHHAVGVPPLFSTSHAIDYDVSEVKMTTELAEYILHGCNEKYKDIYKNKIKFI